MVLHGFDETRWDRPEHPGIEELDAASTAPLVIGRADGHLALVNSATIRLAGIDDVAGLERGPDGAPTGRVTGAANRAVRRWLAASRTEHRHRGAPARRGGSRRRARRHVAPRDVDAEGGRRTRPRGAPAAPRPAPGGRRADPGHDGRPARDRARPARRSAAIFPWTGRSGPGPPPSRRRTRTVPTTGSTYYDDDELAGFFHDAHGAGLQVGVHAIGDRAIEQVLGAWERDLRRAGFARATPLPRAPAPHRALRDAVGPARRACRDARIGGVGAARVRPALGARPAACTRSASGRSARRP